MPAEGVRRRPGRRGVVLAAIAGAGLALAGTTQTWIQVLPAAGSVVRAPIDVPGSSAAAAVAALAVVSLAGAVAAAIAGRVARIVIAVLLAVAGIGIAASAATVFADPRRAAAGVVGEAAGTATVPGDYAVTAWPVLVAVAGACVLAAAVALVVVGRHWNADRKYDPAAAAVPAGTGSGDAVDGPQAAEPGGRSAPAPLDEIDGWDSLSRGEDPTR
ncbi:Trp biosynthesis-associated membrane protein [Zafaria sp. Z1313]|uniref:Trp biosynthesis-associated membrane protein n=1 Tax=unclassified Zafaria TaxID=2828765 RepID=UPI002E79D740|nr:Trp biosynthesis-associated membrane protein [Zafaria sp. J156]MEE1620156.1 Trp biosynthesis-associated membrane protein [Zafaria sp. J156]